MNIYEYISILKQKKQTIFSSVILFLIIAVILTMVQPFKYGAEARILIVQKNQYGADPYQVNKANEYVSDVLADVISSNSFFNEIINSGFDVNRNYFPNRLEDRNKEWKKTVKANSNRHGIISLFVFHKDKYQADQIIRAINAALKDKHALYHGSGDSIEIRVIDQPFTSEAPVKPDIILNLLFGVLFGLLFSLTYAYLFPENKYNLRLWPKRKDKKEYYEEEQEQEFEFGNGVSKERNYDVEEAIKKLRQREKTQAFVPKQNENQRVSRNLSNNDDLDYDNVVKDGSMKNIL